MRNYSTAAASNDGPLDNEVTSQVHNSLLTNNLEVAVTEGNGVWQEVNGGWVQNGNVGSNLQRLSSWRDSNEQMDVPLLLNNDEGSFGREPIDVNHCHRSEDLSSTRHPHAKKQLIIALITCLFFMIAEIIGGYLSNSTAIVTDAAHMMSDFTGFLVSLLAVWISQKSPSTKMSFGFFRAEILGALLSVVLIWIVTAVLICIAVDRIVHRDFDIEADTMMVVSAVGVVMNIVIGVVLHGGCFKVSHHGHSHGPSHGHSHGGSVSHNLSHSGRNVNIRAALIHVVGDLIQSIGVLIAAILIKFRPDWGMADPICTFVFSGLVLFTTVGIVRDAVVVLMEGVPQNLSYRAVHNDLNSIQGVRDVHSLNLWSLSTDKTAATVHLAVGLMADRDQVLLAATGVLQNKYGVANCTVQVEPYNAAAAEYCLQCLPLAD